MKTEYSLEDFIDATMMSAMRLSAKEVAVHCAANANALLPQIKAAWLEELKKSGTVVGGCLRPIWT